MLFVCTDSQRPPTSLRDTVSHVGILRLREVSSVPKVTSWKVVGPLGI